MIRIRPKTYISERFIMDYYDYTKSESIKKYKEKFPQFKTSELIIE